MIGYAIMENCKFDHISPHTYRCYIPVSMGWMLNAPKYTEILGNTWKYLEIHGNTWINGLNVARQKCSKSDHALHFRHVPSWKSWSKWDFSSKYESIINISKSDFHVFPIKLILPKQILFFFKMSIIIMFVYFYFYTNFPSPSM